DEHRAPRAERAPERGSRAQRNRLRCRNDGDGPIGRDEAADRAGTGEDRRIARTMRHEQVEAAGCDRLYFGYEAEGGDERSVERLARPQESTDARLRCGRARHADHAGGDRRHRGQVAAVGFARQIERREHWSRPWIATLWAPTTSKTCDRWRRSVCPAPYSSTSTVPRRTE